MKEITIKQIMQELGYFIAERKKIKKMKLYQIAKEYSYLHFNNIYFSETYEKKDETFFFELIYLIDLILKNTGCKIEKDLVEEIMYKNIAIYIYGSTMYEMDEGEIPDEMFDSISENYPQKMLIDYLFDWSCKSLIFKFSSFDVRLYSYICCKSMIDAAIVASEGGLPVSEELADELSWGNSEENEEEEDEELSEAFAELLGGDADDEEDDDDGDDDFWDDDDDDDDDDDFIDDEDREIEEINNYLDRINFSVSVPARRKLFKEAIEKFPNCVELRLFSAKEYTSLRKKLDIYDEALEIAKKQIGSDEIFNVLSENQGFWGVTKTRPYMTVLFEKAEALYMESADKSAALIWKKMLELCPNDNLGVREYLLEFFLSAGEIEMAKELLTHYPECILPCILWTDIMIAINENNIKRAESLIKMAIGVNKHVPKLLLNKKKYHPDFPGRITIGSEYEAELYCGRFKKFWSNDALKCLKEIVAHEGLI